MGARHHAVVPSEFTGKSDLDQTDDESLQNGREIYETHCASCHGEKGLGEGPAGTVLNPPASPVAHTSQMLSDDYLFWRISEGGIPFDTAMPAWKGILEEAEIWDVIHYMRALGRGQSEMMHEYQAERQDEMLQQATDQELIDEQEAQTFRTVHDSLENYMSDNPDLAGSMDERESAALQALIEEGSITSEQVNTFIEIHDLLSDAGLMP